MGKRITEAGEFLGVFGGETVTQGDIDHGLGRKRDFFDKLAEEREALGLDPAAPAQTRRKDNDSSGDTGDARAIDQAELGALTSGLNPETNVDDDSALADNLIRTPFGRNLAEHLERTLSTYYSTEDPDKTEADRIADKVTADMLRQLVAPEAVLFVSPDDFTSVQKEIHKVAEESIKAAKAAKPIAKKHAKQLPINEEALKQEIMRDPKVKKFRDRYNALHHLPGVAHHAPETGIEPVAAIDGKYGSIGPEFGRYRAKT